MKSAILSGKEDILKGDKKTIDVQKVAFAIWKNRDNADAVKAYTEILCKFADEKRVFNEIEFYLPQLAHMIIHLEIDWANQTLERFAIVICQCSMHAALQLCFMLIAAMEDYQPENANGVKNPLANNTLFFRCARLLQNVERAVVHGSPSLTSAEESTLLAQMTPAKIAELHESELTQRALRIVQTNSPGNGNKISNGISGVLLYKRLTKASPIYRKLWKPRYFRIENRVLCCFHDEQATQLLRTFPLENAVIRVVQNAKHPFYFEIENTSICTLFKLRAQDQATLDAWVTAATREATRPPDSLSAADSTAPAQVARPQNSGDLTPAQLKKSMYFQQQREFITAMTDICERLRFLEKDVRKFYLRRDMSALVVPPFSYLPLCRSLDRFKYVLRALPAEGYAFTTKARCPALMLFEMEQHAEDHCDVASFLAVDLHEYSQSDLQAMRPVAGADEGEDDGALQHEGLTPESQMPMPKLSSRLTRPSRGQPVWNDEGTGLIRLEKSENSHLHTSGPPAPTTFQGGRFSPANTGGGRESPGQLKARTSLSSPDKSTGQSGSLPPAVALEFGEAFSMKAARLKALSPYSQLENWKLDGLIAKSNDDVRQEVFVMQLLIYFQVAFQIAKVPVWLYTYKILSTSKTTGLIQLIPDAISLDGLKKSAGYPGSLRTYFEKSFGFVPGAEEPPALKAAISEFVKSMAGYSIVTYLLAIKDRHNGNIMMDRSGHVIHIDYGFVFGLAPGKAFSMEKAPFKLNEELVEVMGGRQSTYFKEYTKLCVDAFKTARLHAPSLMTLMEIMVDKSNYPAFKYNTHAIYDFQARLMLDLNDNDVEAAVERMINQSYRHTGTDLYDRFQLATNGIAV